MSIWSAWRDTPTCWKRTCCELAWSRTESSLSSGGEHLGTAYNWLSVASGGVRVQVRQDQVAQAKEIIAAFERGDLAIDENPE